MFDLLVKHNFVYVCVSMERAVLHYTETFVGNATLQSQ